MRAIENLVDRKDWLIADQVFSEELYQRELERVFSRCWLLLGHESMIPNNRDYFTHFMGESNVIVQRDGQGRVRAYLNKCRHRGNMICPYDRGSAKSFSCTYHGWTYTDGKLTGVPNRREGYLGDLNMDEWGLIEVPRLALFGGLIFGCWDADAMSLEDYLGDAKFYLENFLLREKLGGLEILPGPQRYTMPANWKLLAENFAGDHYHFSATHGGVLYALKKVEDKRIALTGASTAGKFHGFSVALNHTRGVPHGIWQLRHGPGPMQTDLAAAQELGQDAAEWVIERQRILEESLGALKLKPYSFQGGNIFPNFAMIGVGSALYGKGLIMHHPRGANSTEVWMWCAVEKNAPDSVKQRSRFVLMQRQAAAGMVAPDDHAIFERVTEILNTPESRRWPMHYAMAAGHEQEDPRPPELASEPQDWPGLLAPAYQEVIQRDFYRHWSDLMSAE